MMPGNTRRVLFVVLPKVHLLDLSGPAQVFYEAAGFGAGYQVHFCSATETVRSAQGLALAELEPLPDPVPSDTVLVAGIESSTLDRIESLPADWLRRAYDAGARIGSICTGAFALARAGLLNDRACTTHWKVADRLQRAAPSARVHRNRLFVRDGRLITSAGVASGIDMALSLIEEEHGPVVAGRVAREIVIYLRRNGDAGQVSIFLDYRTHMHPGVHRVQDWLVAHPDRNPGLDKLAAIASMSPRHLTRVFRQATGVTLKAFAHRIKMEVAGALLHNPDLTIESVAAECGFRDPRQLRRLWKRNTGINPSEWKERDRRRSA